MSSAVYVLILLVIIGIYILYRKFFRRPSFGALTMVTGGIKCGKSALCVHYAVKEYKRVHRRWRIRKLFQKMLRRQVSEEPLLYSNIPLRKVKYVPVTIDHLMRKKRFNFGSVVFLDEVSLVCDSMLTKDKDINTQLHLFFKLFGHETHGGKMFVNSQCIGDVHYALKRVISDYYYIDSLSKFPLISVANVRKERYTDDKSTVNTYSEDSDKKLSRVLLFNSVFKKYDSFCFSPFTDELPSVTCLQNLTDWEELKTRQIISFRKEFQNLCEKRQ